MSSAWKVAYADFVTAMMAFFLLLWVLNMVPPETRAGLAAYFSGERNFDSSATSPVSNNPFIQNTDKIDTRDLKISEVEKSHYAIAQKIKQMLMADAVPQSSSGISAVGKPERHLIPPGSFPVPEAPQFCAIWPNTESSQQECAAWLTGIPGRSSPAFRKKAALSIAVSNFSFIVPRSCPIALFIKWLQEPELTKPPLRRV